MKNLNVIGIEELEKIIEERRNFIITVVGFVQGLCFGEGKIVSSKMESSNTHIVREYKDFAGFDMTFSDGETLFGGTTVVIIYEKDVVLDIHFQRGITEDLRVDSFSNDEKWQQAFKDAMDNRETILKEKKRRATEMETSRSKLLEEQKRRNELLEQAQQLKII